MLYFERIRYRTGIGLSRCSGYKMSLSWSKLSYLRRYSPQVKVPLKQMLHFVKLGGLGSRTLSSCSPTHHVQAEQFVVPVWATEATLYVHWPYCEKRCTYCNFNKYISQSIDEERMKKCLVAETETLVKRTHIKTINSVFFGGGTPSLAPASTIRAVVKRIREICAVPPNAEITLEANPTSTEMTKLKEFKEGGVNRISIGLQALSDKDLKVLGRQHLVKEALECIEQAKSVFPGRTSIDVIFGRPGQTIDSWQKELQQVLELSDSHVSLYQLTLERGTALFKQVNQGLLTLPSVEEMADMYECAVETLQAAGLYRYEVSNFARAGAESDHNRSYWRGSQYIGVGPGAHGRYVLQHLEDPRRRAMEPLTRWAMTQTLEPGPWMTEVEQRGHATRRAQPQSTAHVLEEILMLGLRTTEGVPQERWQMLGGNQTLIDIFGSDPHIKIMVENGLIQLDERGLCATGSGLNVIDNITAHLIYILQDHFEMQKFKYN